MSIPELLCWMGIHKWGNWSGVGQGNDTIDDDMLGEHESVDDEPYVTETRNCVRCKVLSIKF